MSFSSDKRKAGDVTLSLQIRASHARSCARHVAEKRGTPRSVIIDEVKATTGIDLNDVANHEDLLTAVGCLDRLRRI